MAGNTNTATSNSNPVVTTDSSGNPIASLAGVAGLGGGVIGGLLGQQNANATQGQANSDLQSAISAIQNLGLPPDISAPLILQQYQAAGQLTPQLEQQINANPSAFNKIQTNPALQQAQSQALQTMAQRSQGGLTPADRAAMNQAINQANQSTRGNIGAIEQNMQARGLGGSGADLAAQLSAAQSGANTANMNADQLSAAASNNALQATAQYGNMAQSQQGQQFNQAAQIAAQNDLTNRFNVQNQLGVQQQNVGAQNQAQAANLANAQNLNNVNTATYNQAQQQNKQNAAQQYGMGLSQASALGGAYNNQANSLTNQAGQQAQAGANTGSGLGGALGGLAMLALADGGMVHDYREGGEVPGEAIMPGDHPINDTVHAKLSPGELVVPRSVAKTDFGRTLAKLLDAHHEIKKALESGKQ